MHILKRIYDKIFVNYTRIKAEVESDILPEIVDIKGKINQVDVLDNRIKEIDNQITAVCSKEKIFNNELLILKESSKKKILLVGFYGAPNLGDELMLETLFQYFGKNENIEITVMINDNEFYEIDDYPAVNVIHYPKTRYDFNTLAQYFDCVVFGGGAIIDDNQFDQADSFKGDLGTILIKLSERFISWHKEVYAVGLSSISKLTNLEYIKRLTGIINESTYFSVRDKNSYDTLKKYCKCNEKSISIISDIIIANKQLTDIKDRSKKIKDIGIVWIPYDENINQLKQLLNSIDKKYKIHLIPFYDYRNFDTNRYKEVLDEVTSSNVILEKYHNKIDEIIEVYNNCDLIISMRYHGVLLGNLLDIPTISICYDKHQHYNNKMKYLADIFGDDMITMTSFDPKSINSQIDSLLKNYKSKKNIIVKLKDDSRDEIESIIDKISK